MHALALFAPVAALMVILPGPDFVQISRISLAEGRARGQAAALGVACGIVVHTTAAVIGLTAVIAGSPLLFGLLTYAGTAYLGWIGAASIRHGLRMAGSVAPADGSADETAPAPVPARPVKRVAERADLPLQPRVAVEVEHGQVTDHRVSAN